jgi:hypothetical protein
MICRKVSFPADLVIINIFHLLYMQERVQSQKNEINSKKELFGDEKREGVADL